MKFRNLKLGAIFGLAGLLELGAIGAVGKFFYDDLNGTKMHSNDIYCPVADIFNGDEAVVNVRVLKDETLSENAYNGFESDDGYFLGFKENLGSVSDVLEKKAGIRLNVVEEKDISLDDISDGNDLVVRDLNARIDENPGDFDGITLILTDRDYLFGNEGMEFSYELTEAISLKSSGLVLLGNYNVTFGLSSNKEIQDLILHEIAHLFYAGHLDDSNCLMYPSVEGGQELCDETIEKLKKYRHKLW